MKKRLFQFAQPILVVFFILFINFLPEFTGFPYWDHDFYFLTPFGFVNTPDARWFGDAVSLLTGNEMIPSLALLWAHFFRALGSLCAIYFLFRFKEYFPLVMGALIIALSPENLPHYLYRYQTIIYSVPLTFICIGLLFVERKGIYPSIVGSILLLLAFGSHSASANSALVLIGGRTLVCVFENKFKQYFKIIIKYCMTCFSAMILQLIITKLLTQAGIATLYNTSTIPLSEIITSLKRITINSFQNLSWSLHLAYMPGIVKLLIGILISLCFVLLVQKFYKENLRKAFIGSILFIGLIPLSRIVFAVSAGHTMHYRVGAFGTTVLTGFFITFIYIITNNKNLKKIISAITFIIIYIFISQNFLFQRHTRDQFLSDILYAQRVVDRIERLDGFNPKKNYRIVFIGTQPYNVKTYWKDYDYTKSIEEFQRSSMAKWMPEQIIHYISPYLTLQNTPLDAIKDQQLRNNIIEYAKTHTWPDKDCITMFDDIIVCILDNKNL